MIIYPGLSISAGHKIQSAMRPLDEDDRTVSEQSQNQLNSDSLGEKLSISPSCASLPQDSVGSLSSSRHYACFTFRFHKNLSFEIESYRSEGEELRMDEFYQDEVILERRVEKEDVKFRHGCLSTKFIAQASQLVYRFCQDASQSKFLAFMQSLASLQIPIFQQTPSKEGDYTLSQALEDLFYRREHTFLIHTFDWSVCHLSFVCCLIIYWMQIEIQNPIEPGLHRKKYQFISQEKIKLKQNVCFIAISYCNERSQQINENQPVLLLLYNFLAIMKRQTCLNLVEINETQYNLINNIKLFRVIQGKESHFTSEINEVIFSSQLRRYECEHKLITSKQKTQAIFNLLCYHFFVATPFLSFYQLDKYRDAQAAYQRKKDSFCLWVLRIVLWECGRRKIDSLHNSVMYIFVFLAILKDMARDDNLEGISYLVPILANIKMHLPQVWDYARRFRPEIDTKIKQYEEKLLRKQYKMDQGLGPKAVLWAQTIFQIGGKMERLQGTKQYIQLNQHKRFYQEIILHLVHYRKSLQKHYSEQIQRNNMRREVGLRFNIYLLDSYVPRLFSSNSPDGLQLQWADFEKRAEEVNRSVVPSIYSRIIDYCFVDSATKFSKMQI